MSKRPRSSETEVALRVDMNRSPTTSSMSMFGGSESGLGSDVSVESSCLSLWDGEVEEDEMIVTRSMMLVGCPGCFMYVMLTDKSSQCPKCKNNVFLDFFNQQKHHAFALFLLLRLVGMRKLSSSPLESTQVNSSL
ncbi:hypothetical protein SDJN02_02722, partial [Cucurbita argyrosperma subsp. argyrosperma]